MFGLWAAKMNANYGSQARSVEVGKALVAAERILQETGVAEYCQRCWAGEFKKIDGRHGCCHGCDLSDPSGCLNKPLSCARWLCCEAKREFPEADKALKAVGNDFNSWLTDGFRVASLKEEFEQLVQIQTLR